MHTDAIQVAQPVVVSLHDLKTGSIPYERLVEAFGPDSLGILVVKDVPPEFARLRHQTLSYASYLGNLPFDQLAKIENPAAKYLTGWSLGKEQLKDGQVDTFKGSFYVNCAFYTDSLLECAKPTEEFSPENFPEYLSPNIWPEVNVLPGFKSSLENLCRLLIDVAVLVARACDRYAEQEVVGYTKGYIEHVVSTSNTTKARLLHYYPQSQQASDGNDDDWCGTHLDHGCLTALTSAMFVDENKISAIIPPNVAAEIAEGTLPVLSEMETSPDPLGGLYIKSRSGQTTRVNIPRDCIAFQTGEALERITRGKFKAVPHFVKGVRASMSNGKVARNTLAVFTQPNLGDEVDTVQGITFGEFSRGVVSKNTVKV